MKLDALVPAQVQTATARPSPLTISRTTVRSVRTGVQAGGTVPYLGLNGGLVTYRG